MRIINGSWEVEIERGHQKYIKGKSSGIGLVISGGTALVPVLN